MISGEFLNVFFRLALRFPEAEIDQGGGGD